MDAIREWWLVESTMRRRARYVNDTPRRVAFHAEWQRAHSKFQGDKEAFRQHQAATLRANLAKAMAAQGKAMLTKEQKGAQLLHSARAQLRLVNAAAARIERQLALSARRLCKPWHIAGYTSLEKWAKVTSEGAEYQRLDWQTHTHARDAKRNALPGTFSVDQWRALMIAHGYRCAYCGRHRTEFRNKTTRTDMEMDHIYPIGHPWARNDESNIVPACKTCNASKGDLDFLEWASGRALIIHPWAMQKYQAIRATNQEAACQA
jgi:5-methylcytosine-specific restriction endonuclease McrA